MLAAVHFWSVMCSHLQLCVFIAGLCEFFVFGIMLLWRMPLIDFVLDSLFCCEISPLLDILVCNSFISQYFIFHLSHENNSRPISMCRQVANRAQMSNARMNNREMLRDYRTPTKRINGGISNGSPASARRHSPTPTKDHGENDETNMEAKVPPLPLGGGDAPEATGAATRVTEPHACFENAPPTPTWEAADDVNPELVSTYRYPRLYLRDPSQIITEQTSTGSDEARSKVYAGELWWFHLAQRMRCTLKHVQHDHWEALLAERQRQQKQSSSQQSNSKHRVSDSAPGSSSLAAQHPQLGCTGLEVPNTYSDGCAAVQDLCLGEPPNPQQQHGRQQNGATTGNRSRTESPLPSFRSKKGASAGSLLPAPAAAAAAGSMVFRPSAAPVNAWSEPSATTFKVRGPTYSRDGIKVHSEPSMFSVVGVDSVVHEGYGGRGGGGEGALGDDATGYPGRWTRACADAGLDAPPFL